MVCWKSRCYLPPKENYKYHLSQLYYILSSNFSPSAWNLQMSYSGPHPPNISPFCMPLSPSPTLSECLPVWPIKCNPRQLWKNIKASQLDHSPKNGSSVNYVPWKHQNDPVPDRQTLLDKATLTGQPHELVILKSNPTAQSNLHVNKTWVLIPQLHKLSSPKPGPANQANLNSSPTDTMRDKHWF